MIIPVVEWIIFIVIAILTEELLTSKSTNYCGSSPSMLSSIHPFTIPLIPADSGREVSYTSDRSSV